MNVIDQCVSENFAIYNADTVEVARGLPDKSVGFSVFSPPFESLYTYSASPRDMGNTSDSEGFFSQYDYLVAETARVMMSGRLVAIHCMPLPSSKTRHGVIGMRDFPGDLIRAYQRHGFVYHSRICIWKDPVTAMQRTKALGLLHKTIRSDSSMSRQGFADDVVIMRAPGDNDEPISHTSEQFPVSMWQRYASPVWVTTGPETHRGFLDCHADINPTETLQHRSAREEKDERHICPLQLEVIRRCVKLWSNPGDVVWSPFAGIGSEGYVALQEGRRFVGAELKSSYYRQAVKNLQSVASPIQADMFSSVAS